MNFKLIAYALDFSSFLIEKSKFSKNIKNIILFGSISRSEESDNSDIDLFIDTNNEKWDFEEILNKFYQSAKAKTYWSLLGIKNRISLKIGNLNDWHALKQSIASNGIILYGNFNPSDADGKNKVIFVWENIKPNSKRVLFNKQIFGYKTKDKYYEGLLQKYSGERLGKGTILVDLENSQKFQEFFKKNKITVKIKKFKEL